MFQLKLRLVLHLRHVNNFIEQNKFWYENRTILLRILSEGDSLREKCSNTE